MKRLRRINPDYLYSDAELNRLFERQMARDGGGSIHLERKRLDDDHTKHVEGVRKQLLRDANKIADAYEKRRTAPAATTSARRYVHTFIKGTPAHLMPGPGKKYRSVFDQAYKSKRGEPTVAEVRALEKKFPSRMTYSVLEGARDPDAVHALAKRAGARLRSHPVDWSGAVERSERAMYDDRPIGQRSAPKRPRSQELRMTRKAAVAAAREQRAIQKRARSAATRLARKHKVASGKAKSAAWARAKKLAGKQHTPGSASYWAAVGSVYARMVK